MQAWQTAAVWLQCEHWGETIFEVEILILSPVFLKVTKSSL